MSRFWSRKIRRSQGYVPGEQSQERPFIKLNTNESPYPPAPAVSRALAAFDAETLKLYPDPGQARLRGALAETFGLEMEQLFVGNGSDEILAFAFQAFFDPPELATNGAETEVEADGALDVLTPTLGYSFYPVYADFFGIPLRKIPLREDLSVDVAAYDRPSRGLVLANPNAPTGLYLDQADLIRLLEQRPERLVLVDEAYVDFAPESAAHLIGRYPNLLVVQTFSKSRSLAGLRLGFALGQSELIKGLEKVRDCINSYTVGRVTEALGLAALSEGRYYAACCAKIMRSRERCIVALRAQGAWVTDSQANFLWLRHARLGGRELYSKLRERGILVRHFEREAERDFVRVTVGSETEMETFLRVFSELERA